MDENSLQSERLSTRIQSHLRSTVVPPVLDSQISLPDDLTFSQLQGLEQAYQEYCARAAADPSIDIVKFSQQHPAFRTALLHRLEIHQYMEQHPELLDKIEPVHWPDSGEDVDGYTILKELGRGSTGRVYLARDTQVEDLQVVIKLSVGGVSEARRISKLKHDNIVPIYRVQAHQDGILTATYMPFDSPFTLVHWIDAAFGDGRKPVSFDNVLQDLFGGEPAEPRATMSYTDGCLRIVVQLAAALTHTHERGIRHLDLKPSNIVLAADGTPRLIDFNLAEDDNQVSDLAGGTKPYMSPEQIQNLLFPDEAQLLTGKSDVYSLALIFCQLLTGEHPFGQASWRGSAAELLLRQRGWSANELRHPAINGSLRKLIGQSLAGAPEARPSMQEFEGRLAGILHRRQEGSFFWKRRKVLASSALVSGIVGVGLAFLVSTVHRPTFESRYEAGMSHLQADRFDEAIRCFSEAIELEKTNPAGWIARAQAFEGRNDMNDTNSIVMDYGKAYDLTHDPRLKACMGYCAVRFRQAYPAGIRFFKESIDEGFSAPNVYTDLGYALMDSGKRIEAQTEFTKAIALDQNNMLARYHRAMNEYDMSRRDNRPISDQAFIDIEVAAQSAAAGPQVYYYAACISDLFATPDRDSRIIGYLTKAIEVGLDPAELDVGPHFQDLKQLPEFIALKQLKCVQRRNRTPMFLHPLDQTELRLVGTE